MKLIFSPMKFEFSMVIFYCSCLLGKYYPPQLGVAPETKDLAVVPQGKCKLYMIDSYASTMTTTPSGM